MTAAPASGLNFYVLHIAGTLESSVIPADGTISSTKLQSNLSLSGDLTVDTNTLKVDATNNRVGVNEASPSHPLHIQASAAGETTMKVESNQAGAMNVAFDVDTDRDLVLQMQEAGTTRWDFLMNGSSGTNPLIIRNQSGTTTQKFTQEGYVTKPAQPGFNASSGSSQHITTSGTVIFGDESGAPNFDTSGNYNTSNGRFTAPVSGVYLISISVYKELNQTMDVNVRINGTIWGEVRNFTGNGNHEEFNNTWIWYLNVNDYVDVYNEQPYLHLNTTMSQFSAALLG
jgi:hypothetical protein